MKRIFLYFAFLLSLSCSDAQISSVTATVARSNNTPNLDTFFDIINLQANTVSNFVIEAPDKVSQWTDLSGSNRHATQTLSGRKPIYNASTGVTFDGTNHRLFLPSEFLFNEGTFFCVFKNNIDGNNRPLSGALSENNRLIYTGGNFEIIVNLGNERAVWQLGQNGQYKILSITKTGSSYIVRVNDRILTSANVVSTLAGAPIKTFSIGFVTATTGFSEASFQAYMMTSKVLDDATRTKIVSALMARYNVATASDVSVLGFGDSITQNTVAYPVLTDVATQLGLPLINCGMTGTRLSNASGTLMNGQDRYASTVITRPYADKIYILFGANDISDGAITEANFGTAMAVVVDGLLAAGYDPDNICVCSPPYRTNYLSIQSRVDGFRTQALNVATSRGVRYADVLQPLLDTGVPDTYMADSLHPTAAGAELIADAIVAAFL